MINELNKLFEEGLLIKQYHPYHDLIIWNYKPIVQYEKLWTPLLMRCRGLVTDFNGKIIARPFLKFFNYEEHKPEDIPNESFDVYDKMDGSLGILFNYNNEWIMATRGSFISEQALKGMEMLNKYDYNRLLNGYTYLFEIIYSTNRIVCYYDYDDLVLLSVIDNSDGSEIDIHESKTLDYGNRIKNICNNLGFKIVKKYDGIEDYTTLKSMISNDAEGYVIRFKNGFRMKIKGEEYCRLHKILTNISNRDIWEYLSNNEPIDELLEKVPDEFFNWVKETIKDFEDKHEKIFGEVITDFWEIETKLIKEQELLDVDYNEREYQKKFAEYAKTKRYTHLLFSYRKELINPKNTTKAIWNLLYPKYQKAFKKDDE